MNLRSMLTVLICVWLVFFAGKAFGQNTNFYLKNNDRIVFYGDSITEQSFYTNFVETYVVTRFPELNVSFTNSGWSGDKIWGGDGGALDERLRRDVFPYRPTIVTAMLGMNDGCYIEFNPDCFKAYTENYEKFVQSLKQNLPSARITLLQPSPFDDWTGSHAWRLAPPVKGGYNQVLVRYGQFVDELARKNKLTAANMNTPLVEVIQNALAADPDSAQKIIPDRIHPSAAGGLLMAVILLESWRAPALVTNVEIDAVAQKITRQDETRISALQTNQGISWTQIDKALPLPFDLTDKSIALVARLSGITDRLNRELLKVKNLSAARYRLNIDGEDIVALTKEELSQGINLAIFQTPMKRQAAAVYKLTEEHNKIHFVRWREIQVPFNQTGLTNTPTVSLALEALETELVKKQRATAQPKPHRYELIPLG